ncbi:MAG: hypothetical protein NTX22_11185 [Ignavibacteriales bacterium]|nr:hypothetical protein [Ignavibacteriales bacterium]
MKAYLKYFFIIFAGVLFFSGCGSNIILKEGGLDFLKGQSVLKVEYNYEGMKVGDLTEEEYTQKKVAEYNEKEKGKGDEWLRNWKRDRADRFQPKFEELMNKNLEGKIKVDPSATSAKYTLILKTLLSDPGWNIGIMRRDAMIRTEAIFVETANHNNILTVIEIKKSPGGTFGGFDFDSGLRMQESYAKCGKTLANYLMDNL